LFVRGWVPLRNRIVDTDYHELNEYLFDVIFDELPDPGLAPPGPFSICCGTALDRERAQRGSGEFQLSTSSPVPIEAVLDGWAIYAADATTFVQSLQGQFRRWQRHRR
jgi:hypothetical protein